MATFEQNFQILKDRAAKNNDMAAIHATTLYEKVKIDPIRLYNKMVRVTNGANSLNQVICGNEGSGVEEVHKAFSDYLYKRQMVSEIRTMSLINLAYEVCYSDENGKWVTANLAKHVLYVLDGVKEFMHIVNTINDPNNSVFHVLKLISQIVDNTYVIIHGTPEEIQEIYNSSRKAEFIYKREALEVKDYDLDMLYKRYRAGLKEGYAQYATDAWGEEFKKKAATYERAIPMKNNELADYLSRYSNSQVLINKNTLKLPDPYVEKKIGIDSVVGLDSVKETLKNFEQLMIFRKRAEMEGMKLPSTNMHMLFTGNPGTGKTTVARIVSGILYNLGITAVDHVFEVSAKDLIAEYLGQTAVKTGEVINQAMGGVLFIDEAYSLTISQQYGKEALAVLIKAMEDHKGDFVVILAGYRDEMQEFLSVNPGLASRIGFKFQFDDYTPEQLTEIFRVKIKNTGFSLEPGVLDDVLRITSMAVSRPNFGNGRFVDKVVDRIILNHAAMQGEGRNFKVLSRDELPTIQDLN